jgi:hypothetical protein
MGWRTHQFAKFRVGGPPADLRKIELSRKGYCESRNEGRNFADDRGSVNLNSAQMGGWRRKIRRIFATDLFLSSENCGRCAVSVKNRRADSSFAAGEQLR